MKRLFVDTNIVIDLLAKREQYYEEAAILFSLADNKKVEAAVSSLTIAIAYYIVQKSNSNAATREILRKLKTLVKVMSVDDKIISRALDDNSFKDFEDAIQYYTALENRQDLIITRNMKDYKPSKIPVMTPGEFIKTLS
ncbi:MAG: PIN domain-containing protein [Bacteroidetes bacterium]|nr:MAG: PIN domain-containing protein [Bacteroidota bacterium]